MTVKRLIWAKFLNAGQTCIAPDYVLVHASIKEAFLALAKEEVVKSQYSVENGNFTRIINEKNLDRLKALIDPSKLVCGGSFDTELRHIEPTILHNVSFDDPIMEEEIFGPILPVLEYTNLSDAIAQVKERPKPLACYVFTTNGVEKKKVLGELSFGNGAVNEAVMQISNPNFGFGGVGESGIGSYHSKAGFDAFSHHKSILDKSNWIETNLKYYPHTEWKFKWIKRLLG
jgi:aldehyde dehydrogenase (NAD+)